MRDDRIRKVVIVGGGTAGWMTAAAMVKVLETMPDLTIELVESEEIGTVGVGEATIPQILLYNRMLGIDEDEFVRVTHATYKLGIEFVDWTRIGHRYIHPFGIYGIDMGGVEFHHHWLKGRTLGDPHTLDDYAITSVAARLGRFMRPDMSRPNSPVSKIAYAFQFDAGLYARYLRAFAEARGAVRIEGRIVDVVQNGETGFIEAVLLQSGKSVEGDLFIDCSGFRGLLIEQVMKAGFEDWSKWLPCDRALAVPCELGGDDLPLTRSTARGAGWQWRIPLQHRMGNGYVYSSAHISDDEAASALLANLDGKPLADPKPLRFLAGHRKQSWVKNVVAFGLASGFLEPLESTSIHLVQAGIARLMSLFPSRRFDQPEIDRFNAMTRREYVDIRDFLVLHYKATERDDSDLWNHVRTMEVPESLARKIALFRGSGRFLREDEELFTETSWTAVFLGQNILPEGHDPLALATSAEEVRAKLAKMRGLIERAVADMPPHAEYVERCIRAAPR
jgi:tryptophan 7-halogenase